jgi:tetratricopeptide (TPR) repeat protein
MNRKCFVTSDTFPFTGSITLRKHQLGYMQIVVARDNRGRSAEGVSSDAGVPVTAVGEREVAILPKIPTRDSQLTLGDASEDQAQFKQALKEFDSACNEFSEKISAFYKESEISPDHSPGEGIRILSYYIMGNYTNPEMQAAELKRLATVVSESTESFKKKLDSADPEVSIKSLENEIVAEVYRRSTKYQLENDPMVGNLKVEGNSVIFMHSGRELAAELDQYGNLSQLSTNIDGFEIHSQNGVRLEQLNAFQELAGSAAERLGQQHDIKHGVLEFDGLENFSIKNNEQTYVVSAVDVLRVEPRPERDESLRKEIQLAETGYKEIETERNSFVEGNNLGKVLSTEFLHTRLTENEVEFALDENLITKDTADKLLSLVEIESRSRNSLKAIEILKTELAERRLVGIDRRGNTVVVDENTVNGNRKYKDEQGKIVAEYTRFGSSFVTSGPGGRYLFRLANFRELNIDGSSVVTESALGYGKPYNISHKAANGDVIYEVRFGSELRDTPGEEIFHDEKRIVTYDVEGQKLVERKYIDQVYGVPSEIKVFNKSGEAIRTYTDQKDEHEDLTPEQYLDKVAAWSEGDYGRLASYLEEFSLYTSDDEQNNVRQDKKDEGEYWQTPAESVRRTAPVNGAGSQQVMLGDCDDQAFLVAEIVRRAGRHAVVLGIPGHALAMEIQENEVGRYDVHTLGTFGYDKNGHWYKRQGHEKGEGGGALMIPGIEDGEFHKSVKYRSDGYETPDQALTVGTRKYQVGGLGLENGAELIFDNKIGAELLTIPAIGERSRFYAPTEALVDPELYGILREADKRRSEGDFAASSRTFSELVRKNPENSAYHFNLGVTYLIEGNSASAIDSLRQAVAISPYDSKAIAALALAHIEAGNVETGKKQLSALIATDTEQLWDVVSIIDHARAVARNDENALSKGEDAVKSVVLERMTLLPYDESTQALAESIAHHYSQYGDVISLREQQVKRFRAEYEAAIEAVGKDKVVQEVAERYKTSLQILVDRHGEFGSFEDAEKINQVIESTFGPEHRADIEYWREKRK